MGYYPLSVMHLIGSLGVGGAEKVISALARGTDRRRLRIFVTALQSGPLAADLAKAGCPVYIRPFKWPTLPKWILAFARELRSKQIHVLHTHLFTTDILGRIAGCLARTPLVVTTYHAPSQWKRSRIFKNVLKKNLDRLTANIMTDGLIAISEEVRQYQVSVGKISPSKFATVPNPVHLPLPPDSRHAVSKLRSNFGFSHEHIIITNVANLKPIKGQDYLVRSIALLSRKYPNIRLVLVGDGELAGELARLSEQLGIDTIVHFMGLRDDVEDILAISDIFVLPSLSEGVSIALLEAMAMRVPVIATAVGGNIDIIQHNDNGLLVPPSSTQDLSAAIEYLINNPDRGRTMAGKAFSTVKKHDARIVARQLEQYYRGLLEAKASPKYGKYDFESGKWSDS